MLVYRIERLDNKGPYEMGKHWWTERSHANHTHPNPYEDGIEHYRLMGKWHDRCGFVSLEQLKNWFNSDELQALHNNMFVLAIYELPIEFVRTGNRQCVFDLDNAMLIDLQELNQLIDLQDICQAA